MVPAHRKAVATVLARWKVRNDDLASVSPPTDEDRRARAAATSSPTSYLPAAERKAWLAFWAEVDALIARAK